MQKVQVLLALCVLLSLSSASTPDWDTFLANTSLVQHNLFSFHNNANLMFHAARAYDNFHDLFFPSTGAFKDQRLKRETADTSELDTTGRSSYGAPSYSYGSSGGYSYGCTSSSCCCKSDSLNDFLPIFALIALSLLLLYLIQQNSNNNNANNGNNAARRKRSFGEDDENLMLDGSTWLSLIHEMWEQDGVVDDPSCAQHTLCRMNYLAMAAPGQAGWAVSLSSMPLSYLLHNRHNGGFSMYMDAALLGRAGANCTSLFSSCPRLH